MKTRNNLLVLIGNWFYKIKEGKTNEEILLLAGLTPSMTTEIRVFLTYISHKQSIERFYTIESLRNLPLHENNFNQNLIMYCNRSLNFETLNNTNRKIICLELDTLINQHIEVDAKFDDLIQNCGNYSDAPYINKEEDYLVYIKKRNPIDVIQQDSKTIKNILSFFLHKRHLYFKESSEIFFRGYKFNIKNDIEFLREEKILTSRLAIIIYKISTLSDESDTIIGSFYRKKLGISSHKKTNRHFEIDGKCYDLNKSPFFNNLELEGAIDA